MEEVKFSYVFIFLLIKITISMSLINLYVEVACAHYEDHMCTYEDQRTSVFSFPQEGIRD